MRQLETFVSILAFIATWVATPASAAAISSTSAPRTETPAVVNPALPHEIFDEGVIHTLYPPCLVVLWIAAGVSIILKRRSDNQTQLLNGEAELAAPPTIVGVVVPVEVEQTVRSQTTCVAATNPLACSHDSQPVDEAAAAAADVCDAPQPSLGGMPGPAPGCCRIIAVDAAESRVAESARSEIGALVAAVRTPSGHKIIRKATILCRHHERKIKRMNDFSSAFDAKFGHVWSCAAHSGFVHTITPPKSISRLSPRREVRLLVGDITLPSVVVENTVVSVYEGIMAQLRAADAHIAAMPIDKCSAVGSQPDSQSEDRHQQCRRARRLEVEVVITMSFRCDAAMIEDL